MNRPTRISPAPLKFPTGGALARMAQRKSKLSTLEKQALEARHAVEKAKLTERLKTTASTPTTRNKAK